MIASTLTNTKKYSRLSYLCVGFRKLNYCLFILTGSLYIAQANFGLPGSRKVLVEASSRSAPTPGFICMLSGVKFPEASMVVH